MMQQQIIDNLNDNQYVFSALLRKIAPVQAGWKPAQEKWSLVEVVNHLLDEELDDFRQRLEFALLKPNKPWMRIEPEKWVVVKNYSRRTLTESLKNFLKEREKSVQWLLGLTAPDWQVKDDYPFGIVLTAEQILANWLAHDLLHIRQINALNYGYLATITPGIDLSYAGNW
jgi:hypothetical protein